MKAKFSALAAVLLLAGMGCFTLAVHYLDVFAHQGRNLFFEVSAKSTVETQARFYHQYELTQSLCNRTPYEPASAFAIGRSDEYRGCRIPLPPFDIQYLRLDPLMAPGEVRLRDMRITDEQGRVVRAIRPSEAEQLNPSASVTVAGDELVVTRAPNNPQDYPALHFKIEYPIGPQPVPNSVTPTAIGLICAALLAGCAWLLWVMARDILRLRRQAAGGHWGRVAGLAAGCFLVVLGLKLAVIAVTQAPFPFWDEWNGEVWMLYVPFANGSLSWREMFMGHNEHRIFFTRAVNLGLLMADGQWPVRVQMVVNAILHAGIGLGLGLVLWKNCGRRYLGWIVLLILLVFGMPFAWENTAWGFQSQFYFMVGFSLLTLWLLGFHRPLSARWFMGLAAALCALFSLASGMLVLGAVAGLMILRMVRERGAWKQSLITLAAIGLFVCFGKRFLILDMDFGMKVHSAGLFLLSFGKAWAWPMVNVPWLGLAFNLPVILLGIEYLRARPRVRHTGVEWVLGLAGWVFIQALAAGYARGAFGGPPEPRHQDLFSIGIVANGLACLLLPEFLDRRFYRTRWWNGYTVAWCLAVLAGVAALSVTALEYGMPQRRQQVERSIRTYETFMKTGNIQEVLGKTFDDLPFPNPMQLLSVFRNEYVRGIMPACAAMPLALVRDGAASDSGFCQEGYETRMPREPGQAWGSYGYAGPAGVGTFVSRPIEPGRHPYLEFRMTGELGPVGNMSLELQELGSALSVPVVPKRSLYATAWQTVTVKRPNRTYRLVARDFDQSRWFAFQEPRPKSRMAAWADALIENAGWVLGTGGAIFAVLLLAFSSESRPRKLT